MIKSYQILSLLELWQGDENESPCLHFENLCVMYAQADFCTMSKVNIEYYFSQLYHAMVMLQAMCFG